MVKKKVQQERLRDNGYNDRAVKCCVRDKMEAGRVGEEDETKGKRYVITAVGLS